MIFDIGANIGNTVERYLRTFPGSRVYCFEPSLGPAAHLRKRFQNDTRVRFHEVAVTRETGRVDLYVNSEPVTNSTLPRPGHDRRYYPARIRPVSRTQVSGISLDDFCSRHEITRLDILKLDIQGGEFEALAGFKTLLPVLAPRIIYLEIQFVPLYEGAGCFHQLYPWLHAAGYGLYDFTSLHRANNGQLKYGDAIFVSPSLRRTIDARPAEP